MIDFGDMLHQDLRACHCSVIYGCRYNGYIQLRFAYVCSGRMGVMPLKGSWIAAS